MVGLHLLSAPSIPPEKVKEMSAGRVRERCTYMAYVQVCTNFQFPLVGEVGSVGTAGNYTTYKTTKWQRSYRYRDPQSSSGAHAIELQPAKLTTDHSFSLLLGIHPPYRYLRDPGRPRGFQGDPSTLRRYHTIIVHPQPPPALRIAARPQAGLPSCISSRLYKV